jgi:hypothetical protein
MRSGSLDGSAWDRRTKFVFIALAAAMLASLPWVVHPYYEANIETNDASMYILSAKALLAGQGYAYVGQPFTIRPPGMSVLLAPIIYFRGVDFGAMNLLVNLVGAAGILALFAWVRPRVGSFVAAALGLFLWLDPGFRHFSNEVMSDVPGLSLTFALLVLERWADRNPSCCRELVLGAAIGLSSYVRTVLILVLLAIVLARLWRNLSAGDPREPWSRLLLQRAGIAFLGTLLVVLPWTLRNAMVAPSGAVDQTFIHSYGVAMWHVDVGDPSSPLRSISDLTKPLPDHVNRLLSLVGTRMETNHAGIAGVALGAGIVVACAWLAWKRKRSAEIYVLILAVVLLFVLREPRDRLTLPLFAIGWAAMAEALCCCGRALAPPEARRGLIAIGFAALAVLGFRYREGWDELARAHRARIEQARAWNERLAPDARVASAIGWHHSVYLGRTVYSLLFAVRRRARDADARAAMGADRNEMQAAEDVIDKYGVNSVILSGGPSDQWPLPYFQRRYGPGLRAGDGWIFRVRS